MWLSSNEDGVKAVAEGSGRLVIARDKERNMATALAFSGAYRLGRLLRFFILKMTTNPLAPVKAVMAAVRA